MIAWVNGCMTNIVEGSLAIYLLTESTVDKECIWTWTLVLDFTANKIYDICNVDFDWTSLQ